MTINIQVLVFDRHTNVERLNLLFLLLSFPLYCTRNIYLFSIVVRRTQNILQVKRNIGMKEFTGYT